MTRRITPKGGYTAHVTVRCNNKAFHLGLEKNFSGIVSWLNTLPLFFEVTVHHVLFMSNHIHMLATPKHDNMGLAMSYFLTNLSKFLNFKNGRINHIFGHRYVPTIIIHDQHLDNVVRYIYQNPVRAGLVKKVHEYPYSSLGFYLGQSNPGMIVSPDSVTHDLFMQGCRGREEWCRNLDHTLSDDDTQQVRRSLTRSLYHDSIGQLDGLLEKNQGYQYEKSGYTRE